MTTQHTTDAEAVLACRAFAKHGTQSGAARELEVDRQTVVRRLAVAEKRRLTAESPIITQEAKQAEEIRQLRATLAAAQREADTAESVRKEIYRLAQEPIEVPAWVSAPFTLENNRGMPSAMWSDWHYGEVVRLTETGGVNEFNLAIADARIQTLVDKTIDLCINHMGDASITYPGFVLMLGGDMISGDIHEELAETNEVPPMVCVRLLKGRLVSAITQLADTFGRVFVPCVPGNHGRTTKKPRAKSRVFHSYEWNLYHQLRDHFAAIGDSRVSFLIPDEPDAHFAIYGHRYLLTHGDTLGVKGGDGIIGAIGPIMRGTMKIGRAEAAVGRDFDTLVIGHWHQTIWAPGDSVFVNNCLKGFDEYARVILRAAASPAAQLLWFTHPKWGITAKWEVKLQKPFELPGQERDRGVILQWNDIA